MRKMLQQACLASIVLAASFGCRTVSTAKTPPLSGITAHCIDTFRLRYQVETGHGRLREIEEPFYVGFLDNGFSAGGNAYKQLVFGDSVSNTIAYTRQDKDGLMFLPCRQGSGPEKALFYFNKNRGEKWKVHIDNSYFWRKEITFIGKHRRKCGDVYVYDVQTDNGYIPLGNRITRIYYSRERGFLQFSVQMHWANIGIVKAE
jgi:hypothetical protein